MKIFAFLKKRIASVFALAVCSAIAYGQTQPIWRESIGGAAVAPPLLAPEAVFVLADNRALQAWHRSGRFLWRVYLSGKPSGVITLTDRYFFYVVTEPQTLLALNRGGEILWNVRLDEKPLHAPAQARDGRLYVPQNRSLCCYSFAGIKKWRAELDGSPALSPVIIDNDLVAIALVNNSFAALDPCGRIVCTVDVGNKITAIAPISARGKTGADRAGVILGYENGSAEAFEIDADGSAASLWIRSGSGVVKSVCAGDNAIGVLRDSGELCVYDAASGADVFKTQTREARSAVKENAVGLFFNNDCWYAETPNAVSAIDSRGGARWSFTSTGTQTRPVCSAEGDVYAAGKDWILYAYRVEARIQPSAALVNQTSPYFGYLDSRSSQYGAFFSADDRTAAAALDEIEDSLNRGEDCLNEAEYIRRLSELALDECGDGMGYSVSLANRVRACSLLGKTGAADAQLALIKILRTEKNASILTAALNALEYISFDMTGDVINAIHQYISTAPAVTASEQPMIAACRALKVICRVMGTPLAEKGADALSQILRRPFSAETKKHASQAMAELVGVK